MHPRPWSSCPRWGFPEPLLCSSPARCCAPAGRTQVLWAFFCIYISLSNPDTPPCHLPITSIFSSYAKRKGYFEACVAGNGQRPRASPSEEPWRVPCRPLDISGTPAEEATCTDSSKQANKMLNYSESHPISLLLDIATLYILMKCVRLKIQNQIHSLTV